MTDYELLRIISFLERMRAPFDETLLRPDPDPTWNMVLFLIAQLSTRGERLDVDLGDDSKRARCKCDAPDSSHDRG